MSTHGFSPRHAWILVDGRPIGVIERTRMHHAEQQLRKHKISGKHGVAWLNAYNAVMCSDDAMSVSWARGPR